MFIKSNPILIFSKILPKPANGLELFKDGQTIIKNILNNFMLRILNPEMPYFVLRI